MLLHAWRRQSSTLLNTCVVPPAAARRGRQGNDRMALKRHFVSKASSSSFQSVMSSLMSSLHVRMTLYG